MSEIRNKLYDLEKCYSYLVEEACVSVYSVQYVYMATGGS